MNCAKCGKRTLRPERVTMEGKGEVLVCQSCFNELGKTEEQAKKSFKRKCRKGSHWDDDLHQCVKDRVPTPKLEEQKAAKELLDAVKYGRTYAYVKGNKGRTKEQVHLPEPQVPAQPIVPVGPITLEQKMDAVEVEITAIKTQIANILGQLEGLSRRVWEALKL